MTKALLAFSRLIDTLTALIGRYVKWLILAAILLSAANAILRKAFDLSSNAWLELQWLLFGAVFVLAAADTLQKNAHVRIDVVSSRLSKRSRDVIELSCHLLFLAPFALILLCLSWPYARDSFIEGEISSNAGGLPVWPAKFIIFCGFLLLILQMISEVIKRGAVIAGVIADPVEQPRHGHTPADTSVGGAHPQ